MVQQSGLGLRLAAAAALQTILRNGRTVEEALAGQAGQFKLDPRDQAFAAGIVLATLRHMGEIDAVLAHFMSKPLPRKSGLAGSLLRTAAAQLLFLGTPRHAAINLAVEGARGDRDARHFASLVNAVLRRVAETGPEVLAASTRPGINTPAWLWKRWRERYGDEVAAAIAAAHVAEPPTDIAVKSEGRHWAESLGGVPIFEDHVRLPPSAGPIPSLPGFSAGEWWVQDIAASLPVRLLGNVEGKRVADLCAAPGGKTLQLCSRGARVTAVDSSPARLERLKENLNRTRFQAEVVCADVREFGEDGLFDGVLLDAPCSATGTIRRHPELPYLRSDGDIRQLAELQESLLRHAARLLAPGGTLVFSTCSLEGEEGEAQVERFLQDDPSFRNDEDALAGTGLPPHFQCGRGMIRTLPHMTLPGADGMDGFFAAALRRQC